MNYHKLLELYKQGQLTEEETQQVASDIEKQEAISEYLFERDENLDLLLTQPKEDTDSKHPQAADKAIPQNTMQTVQPDFVHIINRSIRRAFLKMGAAAAALALCGVLFVMFLLPKIIDCFYYDPGASTGERGNQMSLDLAVYTELRIPGYSRDTVMVQDRGYGDYDIVIPQWFSYTNTMTNLSGRISRGNLTFYNPNLLNPPSGNVFAWFQIHGNSSDSLTDLIDRQHQTNSCCAGSRADAADILEALDENTLYTAYVTLDRMMPYETFIQYLSQLDKEKRLNHVWCAVCTDNGIADTQTKQADSTEMFSARNLGFYCDLTLSHELDWDRERYPELVLMDYRTLGQELGQTQEDAMQTEAYAKKHFTSMLRYIADQKSFLEMMQDSQDYALKADYVEENGLMVYGFAGIGTKEMLLQLNQDAAVYEIYTQPLK